MHCLFPDQPPTLGYAVTGQLRSSVAPAQGSCYQENMNWWRYLTTIPQPRIMVLEDIDEYVGAGALMGGLHAAIGRALNCIGYVTNVRRGICRLWKPWGFIFSRAAFRSRISTHTSLPTAQRWNSEASPSAPEI